MAKNMTGPKTTKKGAPAKAAVKTQPVKTPAATAKAAAPETPDDQHAILDERFAQLMMKLSVKPSAAVERAARRVSQATRERNVCIDVEQSQIAALAASGVVGTPDAPEMPLVLDAHGRLYLNRYWQYERTIARTVLERIDGAQASARDTVHPADRASRLQQRLDDYFPPRDEAKNRDQRAAAAYALANRMCIISGGPGTGKTTTVAVILALLVEFSEQDGLHIALAAPTGKAAARLQESIVSQKQRLPIPADVKAKIPEQAGTMHRLLRTKRGTPYFRHDARNPLAADVIVLDECSMIDAALMAKFMDAVGPHTRLILLGDKDQLSSVEAGAVFNDLCGAGLSCVRQLSYSHRFSGASGIGALSRAVNDGDADAVMAVFSHGYPDIALASSAGRDAYEAALEARIVGGYRDYFGSRTVEEAFGRLKDFRILCALREGDYGVNGVNRLADAVLKKAGLVANRADQFYKGCPVMITENDYGLSLFNGDTGIVWPDETQDGALAVYFEGSETGLRKFNPSSLPAHEVVYAMTVHKSQGSQFTSVLTILPRDASPVVTRELFYTAVTRAELEAHVWAPEAVVRLAAESRTVRHSGLADALIAGTTM